ncbi:DUF2207 domain-containing protein [Pseudoramibacter sp.]|jgi:uncharacterized membrane protein YgcG|uniref:DUF2207 domain-containing protein n=1 Tax=Pseudoramibacter sp. TaxID=2034862 RepID=UPI0025E4637E|nr:DUF2207 domain-containing protein [Pseudoramibacter sp.]MCH4071599.1 DUF2207 domain-containing protein [Pseudoramibacter sp.]MCH4105367.1 DUF2207 domain-containing protein [Pseudoramibacter sp.]
MKRKSLLLFICAAAALMIPLIPVQVCANAGGYTTSAYNVDVKVNTDHAYRVTETIDVNFTEPRHGIYRYIPYKGDFYRQIDGKKSDKAYVAKVSDISVKGGTVDIDRESDNVVLKIGDADTFLTGRHRYIIRYTWNPGDDGISDFDDVYFNVVPTGWSTAIDASTVTVTLPKKFDADKVNLYAGNYGSGDNSYFNVSISGKTITAKSTKALPEGVGATINLRLPDGYFTDVPTNRGPLIVFFAVLAAAVAAAAALFIHADHITPIPEVIAFHPPKGLTPATVGYIASGPSKKHITACIMTLAEKGYISIEQTGKHDFIFHKLKDIDTNEPTPLKTVFKGVTQSGAATTSASLENTFYQNVETAQTEVQMFFDKPENALFSPFSEKSRNALTVVGVALAVAAGFVCSYIAEGTVIFLNGIILAVVFGIDFLACQVLADLTVQGRRNPASRHIGLIILALVIILAIFSLGCLGTSGIDSQWVVVAAQIAFFVIGVLHSSIEHLSEKGRNWTGEILGFRRFIKTAELDRIKALVADNPSYFYDVLPFAYVFNLTDKWAKHFEGLVVEPPSWYTPYDPYTTFNTIYFASMLNRSFDAMQHNMIDVPSSSGSGGFGDFGGGGGFSGGGGGGGGGGSW